MSNYKGNRSRSYGKSRNNRYNSQGRGRGNHRNSRRGPKQSTIDPKMFISKEVKVSAGTEDTYVGREFSSYNLDANLQRNLDKKGFKTTTKVQESVIDTIIGGKDVFAISRTGSGKTGAFLIPMIEKIAKDDSQRLLVIAPTRELAMQIKEEIISMVIGSNIYASLVIGGESIHKQIKQLRRNPQIVVGTPGRLKDVYERGVLDFSNFNNIVLDEVDRMLDMGFVDEIKTIFTQTASTKQSLFFSATTDKRVEKIVKEMINDFEYMQLSQNKPSESVYQDIVEYHDKNQKIDQLNDILLMESVSKTIIFVETKRYADRVGKELREKGHRNGVIHGDKRQNQRRRTIEDFRDSTIQILVATNVVARGIDIDDISHVVNLDTPTSYEDYIHRIGRVGRNGSTGNALTFVEKRR